MPGRGTPLSQLSKADLWSTTLLFPSLGFIGLALSTVPGLIMDPTPQAPIARTIVGAIIWVFSFLCAAGRLHELASRGHWTPFHAASHPRRAAAILVTAVAAISATATLAVIATLHLLLH